MTTTTNLPLSIHCPDVKYLHCFYVPASISSDTWVFTVVHRSFDDLNGFVLMEGTQEAHFLLIQGKVLSIRFRIYGNYICEKVYIYLNEVIWRLSSCYEPVFCW